MQELSRYPSSSITKNLLFELSMCERIAGMAHLRKPSCTAFMLLPFDKESGFAVSGVPIVYSRAFSIRLDFITTSGLMVL